jgi:NADPH:quinone reductase-like Zn-dependent oxidoreductase
MKAIAYQKYGSPEVLRLKEIKKPLPKDNEVLIKIHATSVSSGDVRMRKADPFLVRFMLGLRRPKLEVLGIVFAGEIEAIGKNVTKFKIADKVYGTSFKNFGTYAEYVTLAEDAVITKMPQNIKFEEAAVIPFGGSTALHFLRKAKIEKGQKVLIYGGSGAVGTSAIQVAKYFGAEVTAVCSTSNVELVKSLGADIVIDYTKEDFSKSNVIYDIVFDAVGKSPFAASVSLLKSEGYYLRVVHMSLPPIIKGLWIAMTSKKKIIGGTFTETVHHLEFLNKLIEAGQLKPVIDRTYKMEQIPDAHKYVEEGHKKGNVAISIL